jgi:hypothetical protein
MPTNIWQKLIISSLQPTPLGHNDSMSRKQVNQKTTARHKHTATHNWKDPVEHSNIMMPRTPDMKHESTKKRKYTLKYNQRDTMETHMNLQTSIEDTACKVPSNKMTNEKAGTLLP